MQTIISLFQTYPFDMALVAVVIVAGIVLLATGKIGALKQAVLLLVFMVEEKWGDKTGQIKFTEVMASIKVKFPLLTSFIPEKVLNNIIEAAVTKMKNLIDTVLDDLDEEDEK